ncbi:MAG TPA: zinc metallopeptidase, partial [Bacillota bacterium]
MPFLFNVDYWLFLLPALLFTMWAQARVRGAYERWSQVAAASGFTGADVARELLHRAGIHDVRIEAIGGHLTDHYDPRQRAVRLSPGVYGGRSLAALGIAAHEIGHVLQDRDGYVWLGVRNAIIPLTQFGSQLAMPLFLAGLIFASGFLQDLGILLFLFAVIFQLITLPVEFNASSRAVALLEGGHYVTRNEV